MAGKLKTMKVVDTRFKDRLSTIAFNPGSIIPDAFGFTYRFRYVSKGGGVVDGIGIVENERLGKMSPEEIELRCAVENPVTDEDRRELAAALEMVGLPD